ncbi:glutathione S-transferase N-terminal domain-containing protein [Amnimonas aquatica]|uniref:Stringent starvation protein A n=1 Tax=Amnimonas aquatica TaxID=2094561 RepID=A0A2P6AS41_9GAMM|nr:stringent starvation protein A [Amnimonas aquatica]
MGTVTRRASMTFYSDGADHYSHRVRIVLAEKGVSVDVVNVHAGNRPDDLADLNPYNQLPVLVDRELALYETRIMMEYLDERFPHPPLLPVYPVARAQARLLAYRIERDWCGHVDLLLSGKGRELAVTKARKELRDSLVTVAPVFNEKTFFMSDEFSLLDCMLAPILWRLPVLDIELPERSCRGLLRYMDRVFHRDGFIAALSDAERDMRRG